MLALFLMSTASNINAFILAPFLHQNIAQIARTWCAFIITGGIPTSVTFQNLPPIVPDIQQQSVPHEILQWRQNISSNDAQNTNNTQSNHHKFAHDAPMPLHPNNKENGQYLLIPNCVSTITSYGIHDTSSQQTNPTQYFPFDDLTTDHTTITPPLPLKSQMILTHKSYMKPTNHQNTLHIHLYYNGHKLRRK
jgi:hypothetical protein